MKNPLDIFHTLPKPVVEVLSFSLFVFAGSVVKMRKLHEKGIKITFRRFFVEAFMSFFIAVVAYAVIDQFLHFNKLFTYAFCSVAGSMSELIYSKLEELLITLFNSIKKQLNT